MFERSAPTIKLLDNTQITCPFVVSSNMEYWLSTLLSRPGLYMDNIGLSRAGRPMYGIIVGDGPVNVSITAGAHADEPAGPMTALGMALYLSTNAPRAKEYRTRYTFYICPQVNPDGADTNSSWFAPVPDIKSYLKNVKREGPGDDIEFGYPGNGKDALRPENENVAKFLRSGAPYVYHASLHSMGFAEGAWFLIEKSWTNRTAELREELALLAATYGFKLHDIERKGDKGFNRIGKGFCTTPTSIAMREHFLNANEPGTARKFHLNSMEFIQSLGGDPLCMVSEIPNFAINGGWDPLYDVTGIPWGPHNRQQPEQIDVPAPAPGATAYERGRDSMKERLSSGDIAGAVEVARQYGAVPVPFATHISLQLEMVLAGIGAASRTL